MKNVPDTKTIETILSHVIDMHDREARDVDDYYHFVEIEKDDNCRTSMERRLHRCKGRVSAYRDVIADLNGLLEAVYTLKNF